MFEFGIRGSGDWCTRLISHCDLRDGITAGAILLISKSGMVGIELHDSIAIGAGFVAVGRYHPYVDVVA